MSYGLLELDQLRFPEKQHMKLVLWTWSNSARTVIVEGFTKSGLIHFTNTTNADRSVSTKEEDILELPIAVHVRLSAAHYDARRGECYAKLMLLLGTYQHVLCQGYLCDRQKTLTYPGGQHEDSFSGRGLLRIVTGTNPAAGAEISETVPTNAIWKLYSLRAQLICDATVINRFPSLAIDDGAGAYVFISRVTGGGGHAAGANVVYSWTQHVDFNETRVSSITCPLPLLTLYQGHRITTVTTDLQAGDDWGAPNYLIEEWLQE